jgi:hypothetical protein
VDVHAVVSLELGLCRNVGVAEDPSRARLCIKNGSESRRVVERGSQALCWFLRAPGSDSSVAITHRSALSRGHRLIRCPFLSAQLLTPRSTSAKPPMCASSDVTHRCQSRRGRKMCSSERLSLKSATPALSDHSTAFLVKPVEQNVMGWAPSTDATLRVFEPLRGRPVDRRDANLRRRASCTCRRLPLLRVDRGRVLEAEPTETQRRRLGDVALAIEACRRDMGSGRDRRTHRVRDLSRACE